MIYKYYSDLEYLNILESDNYRNFKNLKCNKIIGSEIIFLNQLNHNIT